MSEPANTFQLDDYAMHHVMNSQEWHIPFLGSVKLPSFLTLHGFMIVLWSIILIFLFCFLYKKNERVPRGITNFLEMFIVFIRDEISIASLGKDDGRKMTPLLCTFFFFILGLNLLGLIPLFATATANINVTGALALITLSVMVFGAIYKNGFLQFLKSFVPSGVPFPILIILVPIEFLSLFIKAFALMIRLFATMLSGHLVILSILGLVGVLGVGFLGLIALPSIVLAVFVSLIEVFIAFLQAYIFTLLSALFIGQLYHPQH